MTALRREWVPAGATRSGAGGFWAFVLAGGRDARDGGRPQQGPARRRGTRRSPDRAPAHGRRRHRPRARGPAAGRPSTSLPSPLVLRGFGEEHRGVVALVTTCPLDAKCSPDLFAESYAGLIGAAMTSMWQAAERLGDQGDDANGAPGDDTQVASVVAALADRPGEPWTLNRIAALCICRAPP